jgi:hypothetical protein
VEKRRKKKEKEKKKTNKKEIPFMGRSTQSDLTGLRAPKRMRPSLFFSQHFPPTLWRRVDI